MKSLKLSWAKWLVLAILLVVGGVFVDRFPIDRGVADLKAANPWMVLLAFLAALASIAAMAEVMAQLLRVSEAKISSLRTLSLTLVSNAWYSTFPGGAAFSTVYQFRTIRSWGVPSAINTWFIIVSGAISTSWLVALGLVSIFFLNADFSVLALLSSTCIILGLAGLVYWVTKHPAQTERVVQGVVRFLARLLRKPSDFGRERIHQMIEQLSQVELSRRRFAWVSLLSFANWALDIVCLWLCIAAVTGVVPGVEKQANTATLLGVTLAFVSSKIVGSAQITPGGIGPIEATLTGTLVAVGMVGTQALASVLVYRFVSFLLVSLIGWAIYLLKEPK